MNPDEHPRLPADAVVDEAHAFALLIWPLRAEEKQAGGNLDYSASPTRRHTDALALERARLLLRDAPVKAPGTNS